MSKGDKYAQKSKVRLFFLSCNLASPLSHVKKTISGPSDVGGWKEKLNEISKTVRSKRDIVLFSFQSKIEEYIGYRIRNVTLKCHQFNDH